MCLILHFSSYGSHPINPQICKPVSCGASMPPRYGTSWPTLVQGGQINQGETMDDPMSLGLCFSPWNMTMITMPSRVVWAPPKNKGLQFMGLRWVYLKGCQCSQPRRTNTGSLKKPVLFCGNLLSLEARTLGWFDICTKIAGAKMGCFSSLNDSPFVGECLRAWAFPFWCFPIFSYRNI